MHGLIPVEQQQFMPALARKRVLVLRERTGTEPEVLRLDNGYRIRLVSPRVLLTMDWRRTRSARTWSYNSALQVDGDHVELARDLEEFVALWHDPDLRTRPRGTTNYTTFRDADLPPLGPPS